MNTSLIFFALDLVIDPTKTSNGSLGVVWIVSKEMGWEREGEGEERLALVGEWTSLVEFCVANQCGGVWLLDFSY